MIVAESATNDAGLQSLSESPTKIGGTATDLFGRRQRMTQYRANDSCRMGARKVTTMSERTYQGSCFCGAVKLTVSGAPAGMGYCHCTSCRTWSAGPVNAFTLWKPEAVKITQGKDNLATYNKTETSYRKWCKSCGGHVLTEHPGLGLVDVYAAVIPDFPFQAGIHVNYGDSVLRMKDGLPKQKDFPKEMGGSGVALPE
jgi:hypothetical protein